MMNFFANPKRRESFGANMDDEGYRRYEKALEKAELEEKEKMRALADQVCAPGDGREADGSPDEPADAPGGDAERATVLREPPNRAVETDSPAAAAPVGWTPALDGGPKLKILAIVLGGAAAALLAALIAIAPGALSSPARIAELESKLDVEKVACVTVKDGVKAGTKLEGDMLETIEVPADYVPDGAAEEAREVEGREARVDLTAGLTISSEMVQKAGTLEEQESNAERIEELERENERLQGELESALKGGGENGG